MKRIGLFLSEKNRLLDYLRKDGIYYGLPHRPVLSGDGKPSRWMLDSLSVTLTSEGIHLAGRCLLKLLESFDGHTLATYGTIGIPLLSSCILQSKGRYQGLILRKEIKSYGSRKSIEGPIHPDEPVIIIDDSISSGSTMLECRTRLEAEGFCVEGGVCLVRFGWNGGFASMQQRGYHMEALYDIWDDFMAFMENEPHLSQNPTKIYPDFHMLDQKAPEGCHPAVLARLVMDEYLRSGHLLAPPETLDRNYNGAGGVWVSVRPKSNIYLRHARNGMWHFPGEAFGPTPHDLLMAALKTAEELEKGDTGRKILAESAIAVTFFSAMEACTVGDLDNDRYGIVVLSRERTGIMGGALPRMPGILNSWQQFQHARIKNAKLAPYEPYTLLRHDVEKVVEPNIIWQPSGVRQPDPKCQQTPWFENPRIAGKIAARALDLVTSNLNKTPPHTRPLSSFPTVKDCDSLYVTCYINGKLRGCMGSPLVGPNPTQKMDEVLQSLCQQVLTDTRFGPAAKAEGKEIEDITQCTAVSVSFLRDPLDIGVLSPQEIMSRLRFGEQALMVSQGERKGMLLPFVCTLFNLNPEGYALEVIDKAGITRPPYYWRRYECQSWLAAPGQIPQPMTGMFPVAKTPKKPEVALPRYALLLSDYLLRCQKEDGALYFRYMPFSDLLTDRIDLPRMSYGCWVLVAMSRSGIYPHHNPMQEAAEKLMIYLLGLVEDGDEEGHNLWMRHEDNESTVSEISFLLLALCASPLLEKYRGVATKIADTLWSKIDRHGRIQVQEMAGDDDALQDYFPGQLLLALAKACAIGIGTVDHHKLQRAFLFYRRRFRYKRDWGQVSWLMQAFTAWWFVTRQKDYAAFVFEIGAWILEFQDKKEGGFLNDHQPDTPGFTTALYVEGLGEAAKMAASLGEKKRATHYQQACWKGIGFLDRLIIQERDFPLLPNNQWALGGVRGGIHQSEVRTDFVLHTLAAILKLLPGTEGLKKEPREVHHG